MPAGRPSGFKVEFVEQAKKLAELGATDEEVAEFLKIDKATLYRWKHQFPKFCEALKVGKAVADERVERSLYQRAIGYRLDAVKIFAEPKTGAEKIVKYVENHAPDTVACIFWLKNRRPDLWRDTQDRVLKGDPNAPIAIIGGQAALDDLRRRVEQAAETSTSPSEARPGDD